MIKQEQANRIKQLIEDHDNIIIFHHVNPDGDCMATSFGLHAVLTDNYPNKNIKVAADVADYTPHLRYMDKYLNWDLTTTTPEHDDYLVIVGDTSVGYRTRFLENFQGHISKTIVYDHHENELTVDNTDEFWSEPDYPAAALMCYELVTAMGLEIKPTAALIINHGVITDTAWYKFAPGSEKTFEISGKLNSIIGEEMQKELTVAMNAREESDVRFHAWVLSNFTIVEGKVSYLCINKEDLDRFGYIPDQAARVNMIGNIKGVESWLFFIQYPDFVRVEFRSNNIWVDEIATSFGGGGHHNASGCKLESMEEHSKVVEAVLAEVKAKGL